MRCPLPGTAVPNRCAAAREMALSDVTENDPSFDAQAELAIVVAAVREAKLRQLRWGVAFPLRGRQGKGGSR